MKNSDFPSVQSVMDDLTGRTSQKAARVEPAPEQLAVRRVDAASSGSALPAHDITEDEEYQKFVESMVPHCRCARNRPCDGVLAGGLCDNIQEDRWESVFDDEEGF